MLSPRRKTSPGQPCESQQDGREDDPAPVPRAVTGRTDETARIPVVRCGHGPARPARIHDDAVGMLAEARWYGSLCLAEMAEHFAAGPGKRGATEDILQAAACYAAEHDLMWEVWALAGGIGNPQAYLKLADPAVRRSIADVILRARSKDAQAAGHIEGALAIVQGHAKR